MRVLVTGDKGFIGQHLTRELVEHGYAVFGHDRENGDLSQPGVFAATFDATQPDLVVHLAAQVGRAFGEDDLAHTVRANATMTTLVAYACGNEAPVLYASTSEVYGDRHGRVTIEESPPNLPHNLYGLTKRWGEEALRLYAPRKLRIVRLSMPYGPGAPPGRGRRAMDNFLWQAHHRMPITVHRNSERSWCHVSDTVRGIRMVMEGRPGIYNVGRDDRPLSMERLAVMACDLAGAPHHLIELADAPPAQTLVKRLNTAKLRQLGWRPTIELEDALPELLAWVSKFDKDGKRCD